MEDHELGAGKTCFIVSPIGDSLAAYGTPELAAYEQSIMMWSKVFEPACSHFNLTVVRADKISDPGEIPDQIFEYLRDAELVVADLSGANANVMYELGLRHSRKASTIQVGEHGRLPFDVATIRTIQFRRDEAGLIDVRDKLIDSIRVALSGGPTPLRVSSIFSGSDSPVELNPEEDARRSIEPKEEEVPDEPGLLEMLAGGEAAVGNMTVTMENASGLIVEIGQLVSEVNADVSKPEVQKKGFAGRLQIVRDLSGKLTPPALELESGSNDFLAEVDAMDAMVRYVLGRVEHEEDAAKAVGFLNDLDGLVEAAGEAAVGIAGMRNGARSLRGLAKDIRPVVDSLERGLSRYLQGIGVLQEWKPLIAKARAFALA